MAWNDTKFKITIFFLVFKTRILHFKRFTKTILEQKFQGLKLRFVKTGFLGMRNIKQIKFKLRLIIKLIIKRDKGIDKWTDCYEIP